MVFFTRIVSGDETWLHHLGPNVKRELVDWNHANTPRKKKFKTASSEEKVMLLCFTIWKDSYIATRGFKFGKALGLSEKLI